MIPTYNPSREPLIELSHLSYRKKEGRKKGRKKEGREGEREEGREKAH